MSPRHAATAFAQPADQPLPTLADARRMLDQWDLSPHRHKNLASDITVLARICGLPENGIELSCPNMNRLLFARHPAASGFTPQRFGKLCSSARFIMRRMELHAPELPGYPALSDPWKALHDIIPPADPGATVNYRQAALVSFMAFCSHSGIEPDKVSPETLDAFETYLTTHTICDDAAARARRIASNWNRARKAFSPAWPAIELQRKGMQRHYTFPLTQYPQLFQDDVETFLDRLADGEEDEVYDDDVATVQDRRFSRGPLRPRTIEGHRDQIRRAATALVHLGEVIFQDLRSLDDLITPFDRVKLIRRFYRDRLGTGPNAQVARTLETLGQIAQRYCRKPPKEVYTIRRWAASARPAWSLCMTEKNQVRLKSLIQPNNLAMLLHFPEELLQRVQDPESGLSPLAAARLIAYAVALEILIVFPMRRSNLAGLRLDKHLQWLNTRRMPVSHIFLSKDEMKGKAGFQWQLPAQSAALIETYLKHYRPLLTGVANQHLFPGPGLKGRSAHELAIGLCGLIEKELGLTVNLHLLRHFGAWIYLNRNPGAYEVVRQILGHKDVRVTIAFYTALEMDAAVRHFDATVLQERAETRDTARVLFRKRPSGKRRAS